MFTKILIANRGEIACRIIRTAHKLGIHCIAVYSEADAHALHVKQADEAYCIGPAPSAESYLCGDKIIAVALKTGAQAIHPGYGFLSENADFAEKCVQAGICFIGPPPAAIRAMGSKSAAKKLMIAAGVPVTPEFKNTKEIVYPILLKASAGGGGKGMRIVSRPDEFKAALEAAKREAKASFGNDEILIEKYIAEPRHVEIQIFADQKGNAVYLFERDCSIQRRHQKIIEEAPAPNLPAELRKRMGECAVAAAKAVNYVGAGTIEFLVDKENNFYFMEMNTRLQVEHPVTEMITGLDLVEWQLRIAMGEVLPLKQNEIKLNGHSFEARIYAEDPQHDFLPSIGTIKYLKSPLDARIDTGITQGDAVSQYYDPMIAKLIVWGKDRDQALGHLVNALDNYHIVGVKTNLDLLTAIANHPAFKKEKISTHFIENHYNDLFKTYQPDEKILELANYYWLLKKQEEAKKLALEQGEPNSPWCQLDGWRVNLSPAIPPAQNTLEATSVYIEGDKIYLLVEGKRYKIINHTVDNSEHEPHAAEIKAQLASPMPGKIVALLAKPGEQVENGAGLAVIEAMKMEHTIHAPTTGVIKEWYFKVGDLVNEGIELLSFQEKKEND